MANSINHMAKGNLKETSAVSIIALATAMVMAPERAHAESFQGTPTVTAGAATITEGATSTNVSVETTQVVIDWVPDDTAVGGGNINFQPIGTTASFDNNPNSFVGNYAVLNRIVPVDPSRMVELNGTIFGSINEVEGSFIGGDIFFYSPGGILIGANAFMDVGSLVLTANDPLVVGGQFINNGTVQFQQATQPGAMIVTSAGSQLIPFGDELAGTPGYLAMVAPIVQHNGDAFVQGSAAIVSADAASITFSPDGLFDIQVLSGTSGTGTTLSVSGTLHVPVGGNAYLAAVPKNDAITIALTADAEVGFDIAEFPIQVGGSTVVLAAGTNVFSGQPATQIAAAGAGGTVDISIDGASVGGATNLTGTGALTITGGSIFRGAITGEVRGAISILADTAGISVADSVFLSNDEFNDTILNYDPVVGAPIIVTASNGNTISVAGDLFLQSDGGSGSFNVGSPDGIGKDVTGGDVTISAIGGTIDVDGDLTANSVGQGRRGLGTNTSGVGTGGTVSILADQGGVISAISISASSRGQTEVSSNGADATGGSVVLGATAGSSITADSLSVLSQGVGGGALAVGGTSGTGTAGEISIIANNSSIAIATTTNLLSLGGSQNSSNGGDAFGGTILLNALAGGSITSGLYTAIAQGTGGQATAVGGTGGNGFGGDIIFSAVDGTITDTNAVVGSSLLRAAGFGGDATQDNGIGGDGQGGFISISASGSTGAISLQDTWNVLAGGFGGDNGDGESGFGANAQGGTGTGGQIIVDIANLANFSIGNGGIFFQASGSGGDSEGTGGIGGSAQGGSAEFNVGTASVLDLSNGSITVDASGFGGTGGASGVGGNATGGVSNFAVTDASVNFTDLTVSAYGFSGGGDASGSAFGGDASLQVADTGGGSSIMSGNFLTVISDAFAGNATTADAGNAIGGQSTVQVNGPNASLSVIGLDVDAEATAGSSGGGAGGDADGGIASIIVNQGALDAGSFLEMSTSAQGGSGAEKPGGSGGGLGGTTSLSILNGGSVSAFSYNILAEGGGGDLTADNSNQTAGEGFGGTVDVDIIDSTMVNTSGGDGSQNTFSATGIGGDVSVSTPTGTGMAGGTGVGGSVQFTVVGANAQVNLSEIFLVADGFGGSLFDFVNQGAGGDGTGGSATLTVGDGALLSIDVGGTSEVAAIGSGGTALGAGSLGGDGFGGGTIIDVSGGMVTFAQGTFLQVLSDGTGGIGELLGGSGEGGSSQVLLSGNSSFTADAVEISSSAGGNNADGGSASLLVDGGQLVVANALEMSTSAQGGFGAENPGGSGGALGGATNLTVQSGGTVSSASFVLSADANGGDLTADVTNSSAGAAQAGSVDVVVTNAVLNNGATSFQSANVFSASAFGGDVDVPEAAGTGMAGGFAIGGEVNFTANGVSTQIDLDSLSIVVDAFGGNVLDPISGSIGGDAFIQGGAFMYVEDGAVVNINAENGQIASGLDAFAFGGNAIGDNSIGGNASSGFASVFVEGGTLDFNGIFFVDTSAFGGDADQAGGTGRAGFAQFAVGNSAIANGLATGDSLTLISEGFGGGAVNGGDGTGGTTNIGIGGSVQLATAILLASGYGANGGTPLDGAGGFGGNGQGGTASINTVAGISQITIGDAILEAIGYGGNGGIGSETANPVGFDGGAGGVGTGGGIFVTHGDFFVEPFETIGASFLSFDTLTAAASGFGGTGGDAGVGTTADGIGGDGGTGNGGVVRLEATGGPISFIQDGLIIVDGVGGDGGLGQSQGIGGDGFIGGVAEERGFPVPASIILETSLSTINNTFGSIETNPGVTFNVFTSATGGTGSVDGTGTKLNRAFYIDSAGNISASILSLFAAYDVADPAAEEEALYFGPGSTTTLDTLSISTVGPLSYANEGSVDVGNLTLNAPDYVFSTLATPTTLGTTTFDNLTYFPAANIILQSNFVSNFGAPAAFATPGDIVVGDVSSPGNLVLQSGGSLTAGQVDSGGTTDIQAAGAISLGGVTSASDLSIDSLSDITVSGDLISGGFTTIFTDGSLSVAGQISSDLSTFIRALGSISIGSLTSGGFVDLIADEDITVGDLINDDFVVEALGTVTATGDWSGIIATVRGSDLVIGSGASISVSNQLIIESLNTTGVFLGTAADGSTGGFEIDQGEFNALSSLDLRILSVGEGPNGSYMEIGDLSVTFSDPLALVGFGNLAGGGGSEGPLVGSGTLLISGDVTTTNAGLNTELAFAAEDLLIDAATGGIFSLDSSGSANGFVTIIADQFLAAEQSVLDQLVADPMLANRVELLNAPTLVTRPDGIFVAGGVGLIGTTQVAIQNTGTSQLPAGFFVVDGFSEFDTTGVEFLISGQIGDGQGGVITGDAVAEIVFTDPDIPLLEGSTVNGCVAVGDCPVIVAGPIETAIKIALTPENELTTITSPQLPDSDGFGDNPDLGDDDGSFDPGLGTGGFEPTEDIGIDESVGGEDPSDVADEVSEAEQEEQEEEEAAEAPIEAPATVIDTSQIDPNRDVFVPVSGGANPSLVGSAKPASDEAGESQ